MIHVLNALVV